MPPARAGSMRGFLLRRLLSLAAFSAASFLAADVVRAQKATAGAAPHPVHVVYPVVMPPYTFKDEAGEAQGLAPDLLRLWSKKTGTPIQFTSAPWNAGLQMMREGKADLHASLYYTEDRDTYLDYATVVASSAGGIFSHKSILGLSSAEDLRAYRVGVVRASYHEEYARRTLPKGSVVSYPEWPEMVAAARKGETRVFIDDVGATVYRLRQRALVDEFRWNPARPLYHNHFWFAVREGEKQLAEALRQGMARITQEERAAIERKWLGTSGVKAPDALVIAVQSHFPPFTFMSPAGQVTGLFADIWRLWAKKMGKKIEFRASSWSDTLDNLKSGGADIHSGLFYSDSRAASFAYAKPFYETGSCLFCSAKGKLPDGPRGLAGKRVAVVGGSYHEEYLRTQQPAVEVIPFTTIEQMLRAVVNGEASACLAEQLSTAALITRLGLSGEFHADVSLLFTRRFHAAVLKENTGLLALVDEGFAALTTDELAETEARWVPDPEERYYGRAARKVALTLEEQAWLKAHPDIQLGYTDTFQPEVIVDPNGTHRGFLVDFLDELNRRLGTRIGLRIYPVGELVAKAQKKEVDGIPDIHPEYADKLGLLKTRAYITGYPTVFARRDASFDRPADLAGKRIAIIDKVFFSEQIVEQYGGGATVLKVKDALEGLRSVAKGETDLFLGASLNSYLIAKYQLFGLAPQCVFYDHPVRCGMGIRPDWPELVAILNKGISSFSEEEIEAIVARWVRPPEQKGVVKLTAAQEAWIAQNHTVRVRLSEHPPLMFTKDGKPVGIAVDLMNVVSERTGVALEFTSGPLPFPAALEGLVRHEGPDVIARLNPTPEREKVILFTRPYVSSPKFIFTRDDAPFVSSMKDLSGRTAAVIDGHLTHQHLAEDHPDINLLICKSSKEALGAVSSGKGFAFIGSLLATSAMINEYGLKNLKASAPSSLPDATVAMGIRSDWPELRDIMDKVLDAMPADEKAAMINKWSTVKVEHGIRPADVLKWVLGVGAAAALIVLLFAVWNRSLNRRVRERTAELATSEERFRATFEQAAVGVAHVAPDGRFLRVNQRFCDIVGYSHEEMLERAHQDITHPEDLGADLDQARQLLDGEAETYSMEKRYVRKDGETVWVNLTVSLVRDDAGEPRWFVAVVEDIAKRKQGEQTILEYQRRLKSLASELTIAEERERRSIAADLHDHVGQTLALARIRLAMACRAASEPALRAMLDEVSQSVLQAAQDTRHLIFDLSSPSMNEIGLAAAISEWLEEQVGKRYGLKTDFVDQVHRVPLTDDVRAILFRNVRELLTNVVKHAHAQTVSVRLERDDGNLRMVIQDDGVGFSADAASRKVGDAGGFGLFSIEERMADLGGSFEVASEPGKGCTAILTMPLSVQ